MQPSMRSINTSGRFACRHGLQEINGDNVRVANLDGNPAIPQPGIQGRTIGECVISSLFNLLESVSRIPACGNTSELEVTSGVGKARHVSIGAPAKARLGYEDDLRSSPRLIAVIDVSFN